ncbi:MAG: hypothetical protein AAF600_11000 [Bacteroidota bacterium]
MKADRILFDRIKKSPYKKEKQFFQTKPNPDIIQQCIVDSSFKKSLEDAKKSLEKQTENLFQN